MNSYLLSMTKFAHTKFMTSMSQHDPLSNNQLPLTVTIFRYFKISTCGKSVLDFGIEK